MLLAPIPMADLTTNIEEVYPILKYKWIDLFASAYKLTNREEEILALIIIGYCNREIATHCYISEKTVKNHIENIMTKLNVRSCRQLMALFIESMIDFE